MDSHKQDSLARRAKAGDLDARNELLESVHKYHCKLAYEIDKDRDLVEDLPNILAVKFLEKFQDWEDNGASFRTYWFQRARGIVKNALEAQRNSYGTDHNYKMRSRDAYLGEATGWLEPEVEAPEPEVRDCTDVLDDRGRRVLRLYHVEGYTQAEIAEEFGVSRKTVNQWIQKYTEAVRSDPRNEEFLS